MKQLYLLRHAKSSWDEPGVEDFQRPLSKRGRRAARLMAEYFAHAALRPDLVLCSPALRTRQTLEILAPALGRAPVSFDARLYEASRQTLLARLGELPPSAGSVLLIGHNPGLERLAQFLAGESSEEPLAVSLREKYPTGALAALSAPVAAWDGIEGGACRLDRFVRPADLEAA